jgi:CheY-like chemotaxis protein
MTWLLVEDDPDIRNFVQMAMTVWGETPLPFPDGRAAWAWLDSVENGSYQGELPELALMDIRMPGHTGDEIAARIRQTEPLKHIPIILMTAFTLSESEVAEMQKRTGFDHLISKPLPELDSLQRLLYSVRDRRRAQNKAAPSVESTQPSEPADPDQPMSVKV